MFWYLVNLVVVFGTAAGLSVTLKATAEEHRRKRQLEERERVVLAREEAFRVGFCQGRRWLAEFIAEVDHARDLALESELRTKARPAPMVKCNVNGSTKERIYHLPFDQQYDRTAIGTIPGECYVATVREAERLGFRRAWRFRGGESR
ncbi:MAG TPA: hypothetical protein VFI25_09025 [Planctomycetota bacterium]|nr:hypothetical protein [Planctomycetota bacterium]